MPKKQITIVRRPAARSAPRLRPKNRRLLALLRKWEHRQLTDEEKAILDGFTEFRKAHPFTLRQLPDEDE